VVKVLSPEFTKIITLVPQQARVLEIGCNDGTLLCALQRHKNVDAHGIEINPQRAAAAVARGLAVVQGDAEHDITHYPDQAFDSVILSQTLPAMRDPRAMLLQLLRVGRQAVVSIPNFAHWRIRAHVVLQGTMPVTGVLSAPWYTTENIHLCTLRDFKALCTECGVKIVQGYSITARGVKPLPTRLQVANWLAEQALFVLER
jgi:methionine biosynthesis protein MetW